MLANGRGLAWGERADFPGGVSVQALAPAGGSPASVAITSPTLSVRLRPSAVPGAGPDLLVGVLAPLAEPVKGVIGETYTPPAPGQPFVPQAAGLVTAEVPVVRPPPPPAPPPPAPAPPPPRRRAKKPPPPRKRAKKPPPPRKRAKKPPPPRKGTKPRPPPPRKGAKKPPPPRKYNRARPPPPRKPKATRPIEVLSTHPPPLPAYANPKLPLPRAGKRPAGKRPAGKLPAGKQPGRRPWLGKAPRRKPARTRPPRKITRKIVHRG